MNRDSHRGIKFADSAAACAHQVPYDIHPDLFPAEPAVGLVADLHHADVRAAFPQDVQALQRIPVQGVRLFLNTQPGPGFRDLLLARIRPEIGIMKIHQQLHAVLRRPFPDQDRVLQITVAAAVASSVRSIGIIPDTDTDIIDPRAGKQREKILLRAVPAAVGHAALLQRGHAGNIHAEDKILGQAFDFPDKQP